MPAKKVSKKIVNEEEEEVMEKELEIAHEDTQKN